MFFIVMIMIHVPGRFVGFDFPAYSVVAPDSVAETRLCSRGSTEELSTVVPRNLQPREIRVM
ncbi:hypothetical protein DPMN_021795 [Dreissena polymorpha]|uniref:Uncharacterized protein n=1 Tax=Dreissena polymorpha TaxID=45954 RepID=A0A9D4NJ64_DREPO|nr:hypothetical protein DPMN_021795 [Dreissena polymorpha]